MLRTSGYKPITHHTLKEIGAVSPCLKEVNNPVEGGSGIVFLVSLGFKCSTKFFNQFSVPGKSMWKGEVECVDTP